MVGQASGEGCSLGLLLGSLGHLRNFPEVLCLDGRGLSWRELN